MRVPVLFICLCFGLAGAVGWAGLTVSSPSPFYLSSVH